MRVRSVTLAGLFFSSLTVSRAADYLLWQMTPPEWLYEGKPINRLQTISDTNKLVPNQGSGEALLLQNGFYSVVRCVSPVECLKPEKVSTPPPAASDDRWWSQLMAGVKSLTARPAFQLPMSRAAGWRDAVVVKGADGRIDLKPVFAVARPRSLGFDLCSIEDDRCVRGLAVQWDGTAAWLKDQPDLPFGTYRLIASSGTNEAWIRVVAVGEYVEVTKAFERAVAMIRTWSLPTGWDTAPSLDRLERLALAGVKHGE